MPNFATVKLADIAEIITGSTPPASQPDSWGNEVEFITPSDQSDSYREANPSRFLSADGAARLRKRLVPARSTNLTCIGSTIGKVSMAMSEAVTNQQINSIVAKSDIANPDFIYYMIKNWSTALKQYASGSATPIINKSALSNYEFSIPPLAIQQAIAEVLAALDDKIAANTKLAQTAEDLLQSSYRGLINEVASQRVRVGNLVRRISPARKFTKSDLVPQGDFPVFDQSESGFLGYLNGEGYLDASTDHPLLYFGDHTCKLRIATQRFTVGPNTVPFTGLAIPSLTLYCALKGVQKLEEYKRHWLLMMEKEVLVPEAKDAEDFATRHRDLLTLFRSLNRENQQLAATRDALLPQLMSGRLKVKQGEENVASAV